MKKIEYLWNYLRFRLFSYMMNEQTWSQHDDLLHWAEKKYKQPQPSPKAYLKSTDPVVKQGWHLLTQTKKKFRNVLKGKIRLRIVIHIPPAYLSPGGYSLFRNLAQGLEYIGVPVFFLEWGSDVKKMLQTFKPNVLITSDSPDYLKDLDWEAIQSFRKEHQLLLGITASMTDTESDFFSKKIKRAKQYGVNFFYTFFSFGDTAVSKRYDPFLKKGYPLFSIEFGANPLLYHPEPYIQRDIPYVFLASSNTDKWPRYFSYLPKVMKKYPGFLDGPGWSRIKKWSRPEVHRFLYARAKVGLNLHVDNSITAPTELNERTYILAACGVPQLVDNALLLPKRFSKGCFFIAHSPQEYFSLFEKMLSSPKEAQKRALKAQKEVFARHTSFHRAKTFALQLEKLLRTKN
jgi:hypothetical protein